MFAGEVAVDPGDNGADILEDTTEDADSRSSEVAAAVEHLLDTPVPQTELPVIPLADAVTAAGGAATAITVLDTEIAPGTAQRCSRVFLCRRRYWSSTGRCPARHCA
ncbi:MAG: hypothetical protein P8X81_09460 [Woeseiaceae bacterium]